jgi:DNA-binding NtrC family response regulator
VHVPSLRERKSDIPTLVHWFLDRYAPGRMMQVSSDAMKNMLQYDWPGNVRELENCIERAVALGADNSLRLDDLPPAIRQAEDSAGYRRPGAESIRNLPLADSDLEEIERATILRVFEQVQGDKVLAGKMLGISRATLYRKLKRYNIGSLAKGAAAAMSS